LSKVHLSLLALIVHGLISVNGYTIEFDNFSTRVTLIPVAGDQYLLPGNINVKLTNRIVIKASAAVTKEQITNIDPQITGVQELYRLKNSSYYVVSVKDLKGIDSVLHRFEAWPHVVSVQPDLLQLNEKAHWPGDQHRNVNHTDYIGKLGINALWQKTHGENVKIAIIDDGIDLEHEDLRGVNLVFAYDVDSGTLNPSPGTIFDHHGTKVAGIMFAQHNDMGIDGIAPNAGVIAIRHPDTWTSKSILSFYIAKLAGADVINCSWNTKYLLEPLADVIQDLTTGGRGGKGLVMVFAAGNQGLDLAKSQCEATLPRVIAVGAVDRWGVRLPSSNYGPNVDIFTYGTSILVPSRGPQKYTLFSGTSASSAIVSGVAALILSQNRAISLAEVHRGLDSIFGQR